MAPRVCSPRSARSIHGCAISKEMPAVKDYEFAKLQNNEVLLINPKDRQVAEIIMQQSTTGQGSRGK